MPTQYGATGVGRIGVDRRRTRARSVPTGWETKQGEVSGQELEFENGYRVLAVTIPGLKATIKGLDAWKSTMANLEQWTAVVREWIHSEEANMRGKIAATWEMGAKPPAAAEAQALEKKVDMLADAVAKLTEALSQTR
jgi:hypothetical protein